MEGVGLGTDLSSRQLVMGLGESGDEDEGGEGEESGEGGEGKKDQMCQRIGDFGPWQVCFVK